MKWLLITMFSVLVNASAYAEPIVASVNMSTGVISGSAFGTKATPAPAFFNTMETVPIGNHPPDMPIGTGGGIGVPVASSPVRGDSSRAMLFSADLTAVDAGNEAYWGRAAYDNGTGVNEFYITYWQYLDKTITCTGVPSNDCFFQWKHGYTGSDPSGYVINDSVTISLGMNSWWYENAGNFANVFVISYYNGLTWGASASPNHPADGFAFGVWQRVTKRIQKSSSANTADGVFYVDVLGGDIFVNDSSVITHDADDDPLRYVIFGQAVESVNINTVGDGGRVEWDAYFDDIYIDTTQSRVEICDTNTWSARTHCEVQPPTAWSANGESITVTINQGSIPDGAAYVYVVDASGSVNATGKATTIGGSSGGTMTLTGNSTATLGGNSTMTIQ